MDSSGEQLHPNWRALTTIHYPLKRFVQSGRLGAGADYKEPVDKYEVQGVSGEEAQQFYEEMLNDTRNANKVNAKRRRLQKTETRRRRDEAVHQTRVPFEAQKFFRYAMGNNVAELQRIDYQIGDINTRDTFGWTALMMAACEGATQAVEYLLQLGADRAAKDKQGNTACSLASKKGHSQIVALIEKAASVETSAAQTESDSMSQQAIEPFYCAVCKQTFTETTLRQHQTSTVHQFNAKSDLPVNKLQKFNIPARNRGLQLMLKQGWDKESGLGPTQTGRLYPVKTVIRKQRSGLGIEQPPARVTHFEAFDIRAIQRNGVCTERKQARSRNDMRREKQREWKRERRLRKELS